MPKHHSSGEAVAGERDQPDEVRETGADTVARPKKRVKRDIVSIANALEPQLFHSRFIESGWLSCSKEVNGVGTEFNIQHRPSKQLPYRDFESCFNLIETTSREDYENSSLGWRPPHKRREMKETDMHYLTLRRVTVPSDDQAKPSSKGQQQPVEGFLSFMITFDSRPLVPVLYIYEIHLSDTVRTLGLGTHLMTTAERIASKVGVAKVMLTCFLSNAVARAFYKRRSFERDTCSPDDREMRNKVVKVDYEILSKPISGG